MTLRYRILLIATMLILGFIGIVVYQQYVSAKAQSGTPATIQYDCVPAPSAQVPPSAPPTVTVGQKKVTYTAPSQQLPSCSPGYVTQPIGKHAPKGMPRP
ncbi:MAG: hypothetical protein NVS4B12_18410 [Ktedonobacteraceae bacterium]